MVMVVGWTGLLWVVAGRAKACRKWKTPRPSAACGLITLSYSERGTVLKIRH